MSDVAEFSRSPRGRVLLLTLMVALVAAGVVLRVHHGHDEAAPLAVPAPPADAPEIGMYVQSRVLPNNRILVQQWISARTPIRSLAVRTTDPNRSLGTVVARKIEVLGDDGLLARRREIATKLQHVRLRHAATQVYLSYVILGGVNPDGSVKGRVLARVTSLDVDYDGAGGPVKRRVETDGGKVLAAGCLSRTTGVNPSACGAAAVGGAWEVTLIGKDRDERLIASLDVARE